MSPGGQVSVVGEFTCHTSHHSKPYNFRYIVSDKAGSNLLSRSVAVGLVSQSADVSHVHVVTEIDSGAFEDCGLMKTEPVTIHLKGGAVPYAVNTARRIAFPLMKKVEEELKRLQGHNVIIPVTESSEWCAPICLVLKKNGSVRITVDYKRSNQNVKHQQYMLPNLDDVAPKLAGSQVFSALACTAGYHQLPLSVKSSMLTMFMTLFGRYMYWFLRMCEGECMP